MRRNLIILIILAVVAGGLAIAWRQGALTPPEPAPAQRPNVRTVIIDRGDLVLVVNATGTIAPERNARINFDIPGVIAEVLVKEGDTVKEGQILARIDDSAQRLSLAQAESNVKTADLQIYQLLQPPKKEDIAVAEANIRAAQGQYSAIATSVKPEQIRAAESRYQGAIVAWDEAKARTKQAGGMYALDSTQYQLALAQEGQASFNAEMSRLQLEQLKRGPEKRQLSAAASRITQAQAVLAQLRAGPQQIDIDRAQVTLEQAKLARDQAKLQLDHTVVKAPFAGVVTTVNAKKGALTTSSQFAFAVTDDSNFHVDVKVDEVDIAQLQIGQSVSLTLDALPGRTLNGTLDRISFVSNQDSNVVTYTVRVKLDKTDAPVKTGMTASTIIVVRDLKDVVRVPNLYVRLDRRSNQAYVNLVNPDGSLTEVQVQLGLRTDEYSEVLSGLNEGDRVGISLENNSLFGN